MENRLYSAYSYFGSLLYNYHRNIPNQLKSLNLLLELNDKYNNTSYFMFHTRLNYSLLGFNTPPLASRTIHYIIHNAWRAIQSVSNDWTFKNR